MAYSDRDRRPRSDTYQRRDGTRQRDQRREGSRGGRENGGQQRRRSSQSNSRGSIRSSGTREPRALGGGRADYQLRHQRGIGFRNSRSIFSTRDPLGLIAVIIVIVIIVLIIVGIASCVSSSAQQADQSAQEETARVASGISDDLSAQLNTRLDQDDQIAQIAQSADQYPDERLVELALNEPSAISLVAGYLTSDKTAESYDETTAVGTYPQLYCWDSRWGDVDYAGSALAVNGSGPTVVSMAYMGLTGQSNESPADIASMVTSSGLASGDTYFDATFLTDNVSTLGLSCKSYDTTSDNITSALTSGTVIAVSVQADTLTSEAHWILLVENGDTGLVVHDPTSTSVSARTWQVSEIVSAADATFYALSASSSSSSSS